MKRLNIKFSSINVYLQDKLIKPTLKACLLDNRLTYGSFKLKANEK